MDIHLRRLHQRPGGDVQQLPRLRNGPAPRDGHGGVPRREVREQVRHGGAGLRAPVH